MTTGYFCKELLLISTLVSYALATPMRPPSTSTSRTSRSLSLEVSGSSTANQRSDLSTHEALIKPSSQVQSRPNRKWAYRIRTAQRKLNENLPLFERWVEDSKNEFQDDVNDTPSIDPSNGSAITSHLTNRKAKSRPVGLLKLRRFFHREITKNKIFDDLVHKEYVFRLRGLLKRLPDMRVPALPLEEQRARRRDTWNRYRTRKKAKGVGVHVQALAIGTGRRRGYSDNEPGIEEYRKKGNEHQKAKRTRARMDKSAMVSKETDSKTRIETPSPKVDDAQAFPTWGSKKQRTREIMYP